MSETSRRGMLQLLAAGALSRRALGQTGKSPGALVGGPPAAAATPASTAPVAKKPLFALKPEKGFFDDPYDLDPTAGELLLVRTDSASFAELAVVELATGRPTLAVPLGDPQRLFERVLFADEGKGFVVIVRDPTSGKRSAQLFGRDGKPVTLVGPFNDFGLAVRGGNRLLIGWDRTSGSNGDTSHTIVQHRLAGLTRVGRPVSFSINKEGELKKEGFKVLGWQDGYAQLVGVRPGGYDKGKDLRVPDKAAVYDVLDRKFAWEGEIGEPLTWAAAAQLRARRPQRTLFTVLSDEGDQIAVVDFRGRHAPLALPVSLGLYEPRSLLEQEEPGGTLVHFSLSIDPLNADALARRKKDVAYLDLYDAGWDASSAAPKATVTHRVRVLLGERPVSWLVRGNRFALLRKYGSFARGGTIIEVYPLD